ncbi:MAG: four helix bundle protein [Natronospirillum sp.]
MKDNQVLDRSFDFAVRVVNLNKYLAGEKKEYVLSKQLLRSGTSIGANINEAQAAQSRNDFISKMCIASKEARETKYWLKLLVATDYLPESHPNTKSLLAEAETLIKILTAIIKSTQAKQLSREGTQT